MVSMAAMTLIARWGEGEENFKVKSGCLWTYLITDGRNPIGSVPNILKHRGFRDILELDISNRPKW